jgi:hypothetical protein
VMMVAAAGVVAVAAAGCPRPPATDKGQEDTFTTSSAAPYERPGARARAFSTSACFLSASTDGAGHGLTRRRCERYRGYIPRHDATRRYYALSLVFLCAVTTPLVRPAVVACLGPLSCGRSQSRELSLIREAVALRLEDAARRSLRHPRESYSSSGCRRCDVSAVGSLRRSASICALRSAGALTALRRSVPAEACLSSRCC